VRRVRYVYLHRRLTPWERFYVFLAALLALGVFTASFILALGLLLIFAPVLAGLALVLYVLRKIMGGRPPPSPPAGDNVIDGEFRVIDPDAPRIGARHPEGTPE
jgi:hypothetical protein